MSNKQPTLDELKQTIHELDPELKETDDYFKSALVLLTALYVGPRVVAVSKFTGLPRQFVRERAARLRDSKVWVKGATQGEWRDPDNGGIAFWMDVAVAEGLLARQ